MFPAYQSRCLIQKGLLTKALNSVKSSKDEFCQAMEGNSSALTKKRKAEEFVDRVSNVSVRKSQLEDAYDKLVEHCYELSKTDFEPVTTPQVMAEYLNRQMLDLISTSDSTMIRYEEKVREAESHLSMTELASTQPPAQPPPPPPTSPTARQPASRPSLAIFRPNQDLKPCMLEKECSYQECMHFIELWTSYFIAGYGSEEISHRRLSSYNYSHSSMPPGGPNF